ncbi:MAG TPA: Re/Si-specific NAD(P)(+) transhydrogenase subunit alpha [Polyangiaceae bacterium]|jgi:NAD(P) transhydrogenase subunit alpha|nr:Re/Si-specific NAD(P)(+) transhydrogenase subunit alpha [Polyangiaceae bacterium]
MVSVLVAKERVDGETRVSATPETVKGMIKAGLSVVIESTAGENAFISDTQYTDAGATVATDPKAAWAAADVVLKVRAPQKHPSFDEIEAPRDGATVIGFLAPYANDDMIRRYAAKRISSLPMELVPRITRAQKMDALSSQANIAGYKAVLVAAANLPKYFPLFMTAAGTVKPARVVIMGAGVAGLQAIATAKRLGAVVEASDIRPETKEQIQSLGGKFIELPKSEESGAGAGGYAREVSADFLKQQQEIVGRHVAQADVVITTALVPGRPAPKLLPASMVEKMKAGSVIVDLAVEQGGNCELSERGKDVRKHGVLIIGHPNLPATLPADASMLYSRNVLALLQNILSKEGALNYDLTDEVTSGTLLTHDGKIVHAPTAQRLGAA